MLAMAVVERKLREGCFQEKEGSKRKSKRTRAKAKARAS